MRKTPSIFGLLGAVFLLAGLVSVLSITLYSRLQRPAHDDAHAWIHTQLGLTAEQEKEIAPIELEYHHQSHRLEEQMRASNQELAQAILAEGKDSPRVREAIEKTHRAMGELQLVTIGHVFAMKKALTPAQYDKLLRLTADALGKLDAEPAGHE